MAAGARETRNKTRQEHFSASPEWGERVEEDATQVRERDPPYAPPATVNRRSHSSPFSQSIAVPVSDERLAGALELRDLRCIPRGCARSRVIESGGSSPSTIAQLGYSEPFQACIVRMHEAVRCCHYICCNGLVCGCAPVYNERTRCSSCTCCCNRDGESALAAQAPILHLDDCASRRYLSRHAPE